MRTRRRAHLFLSVAAAAAMLAAPPPAFAWGEDGHDIVASVAFQNLDPRLVREARRILNDLPVVRYRDDRGNMRVCQGRNLREISVWADCIRYSPERRWNSTADFHFDDIPLCGTARSKNDYCPGGNCASAALERFIAMVRDPQTSRPDRAVALAFIIHIVGDLHQPLHTITNNDAGGNGVTVDVAPGVLPGTRRPTKLHSFWDGSMVLAGVANITEAVGAVNQLAGANHRRWRERDPDAWVRETHVIARDAYDRLPDRPACNDRSHDAGELGADYANRFTPRVREQLAMAAVRLRDKLIEALRS